MIVHIVYESVLFFGFQFILNADKLIVDQVVMIYPKRKLLFERIRVWFLD